MKWFKHMTDSLDDPFIQSLLDKFSHAGYIAWFGLIEIIAKENGNNITGKLDISPAFLKRKLRISQAKLRQIFGFCSTNAKLLFDCSKEKWHFEFDKILEIKDNYTRDLQVSCKKPSIEVEVEVEVEKKRKEPPLPPKGGMKVVERETVSDSGTALPETKTPIAGKTESLIGSLHIKNVLLEFKTIYPRINGKFPAEQEVLRRLHWWPPEDIPNILLAAKNYAASERVRKGVGVKDPANFVDTPHNPHPFWKDWLEPEKPPPPKGLTRSIGPTPNMLILAEMIAAEEKEKQRKSSQLDEKHRQGCAET